MRTSKGKYWFFAGAALSVLLLKATAATTLYVDINSTNPVSPYVDWTTAATNIQDAIDAGSAGDTVLVTNGVYATGGKVMSGDLTNRVALDKALTVQSVGGPAVTIIQGTGATNGAAAVRGAWLTNGASLIGFTICYGATRTSGDTSGGGIWSISTNTLIANCVIVTNTAALNGGGVFQGTLTNCRVVGNKAANYGGGACGTTLVNCRVLANSSASWGGGTYYGTLMNCAVVGNAGLCATFYSTLINCTVSGHSNYGVINCQCTNCIIFWNGGGNYGGSTLSYCCTMPTAPGTGNLVADPQLLGDGFHLASISPCRGQGKSSVLTGVDIDGQAWSNPPSMGCYEWQPAPAVDQSKILSATAPFGFSLSAATAGQAPFVFWWTKDGNAVENDSHYSSAHEATLAVRGLTAADAGNYQVVVSNSFGMATSLVAQVVIHFVDVAGRAPTPPYLSWANAATNIQDAIDAAVAGEFVLVTNGVYASGGKVMAGDLTNRVVVDKPLTVASVNGYRATIIQGCGPTPVMGPSAVRCAWLTSGTTIIGFTLCGGATRTNGDRYTLQSGGGVWCASTNALVANCLIATNAANAFGGGAYGVMLNNSLVVSNSVLNVSFAGAAGGGVYQGILSGCVVTGNWAAPLNAIGGGAAYSVLLNCTVTGNYNYGTVSCRATNCLVYFNMFSSSGGSPNYNGGSFAYCCTTPQPSGSGNIAADPQLIGDGIHLSSTSPCRGAGTNLISGTDIDGQSWANPPAIGCDEWQPTPLIVVQPSPQFVGSPNRIVFNMTTIAGQLPFACFWSKDGVPLEDGGKYGAQTPILAVGSLDSSDAGTYQLVVSNAFGMATSQLAQVVIHCVDSAGAGSVPPYSTWASAATNIQDAIDEASAGEFVLVTNGIYSGGGKVMEGDLTNRVVLDKALTVMSVNGYAATIVQGAWDLLTTNGPGAVRCAWVTNGATLGGFTLQGGATRSTGPGPVLSGGGALLLDGGAIANCLIWNNAATFLGGGISGSSLSAGLSRPLGTIRNSQILGNRAQLGGGVAGANMYNSFLQGNLASYQGGGIYSSNMAYCITIANCTIISNSAAGSVGGSGYGGGVYCYNSPFNPPTVANNVVYFNSGIMPNLYESWGAATNCCITSAYGNGNITTDPQLVDGMHLSVTSPCLGAGASAFVSGTDIEGDPWSSPPSIGCDEVVSSALVGPLSVTVQAAQASLLVNRRLPLTGLITGRASRIEWSFGDGPIATNLSFITSHTWTNSGDYTVTCFAYNNDNPAGISGDVLVHVLPLIQPLIEAPCLATNKFQFQFTGQSNATYVLQMTTNLTPPVAWQTLQTLSCTGGVVQATDPAATNVAQFYRVLAQ